MTSILSSQSSYSFERPNDSITASIWKFFLSPTLTIYFLTESLFVGKDIKNFLYSDNNLWLKIGIRVFTLSVRASKKS